MKLMGIDLVTLTKKQIDTIKAFAEKQMNMGD